MEHRRRGRRRWRDRKKLRTFDANVALYTTLEDYDENKLEAQLEKLGLERKAESWKKVTSPFLYLKVAWKGFSDVHVLGQWDDIMGLGGAESDEEE